MTHAEYEALGARLQAGIQVTAQELVEMEQHILGCVEIVCRRERERNQSQGEAL